MFSYFNYEFCGVFVPIHLTYFLKLQKDLE